MDREQEIFMTEEDAIETLKDYIFGNFEIPRNVRHAISFAIELIEEEME